MPLLVDDRLLARSERLRSENSEPCQQCSTASLGPAKGPGPSTL